MFESPQVAVRFPREMGLRGALLRWRQHGDGTWWAVVAVEIPAGAVGRLDADYSSVTRERAYVVDSDLPGRRRLHVVGADCLMLALVKKKAYLTPVSEAAARTLLAEPDVVVCDECSPQP